MMSLLAQVIERAKRLPAEQSVHILGALLDAARLRGEPAHSHWLDPYQAAWARATGVLPPHLERLLIPRSPARLLEAVLVAPIVTLPQWAMMFPRMPQWARIAVAPALRRFTRNQRDELVRTLPVIASDRLIQMLEPGIVTWWPDGETAVLVRELDGALDASPGALADPIGELLQRLYQQQQSQQQQASPVSVGTGSPLLEKHVAEKAHGGTSYLDPGLYVEEERRDIDDLIEEDDDDLYGDDDLRRDSAIVEEPSLSPERDGHRVSVGLSDANAPWRPAPDALLPSRRYWLWVEVGRGRSAGAIGIGPVLPTVATGAELDVVVFAYPGQLAIDPERRNGKLRIDGPGPAMVVIPAGQPFDGRGADLYRLSFPIETPANPGPAAIRINIYHRGLLLQSHRVIATVGHDALGLTATEHDVDYALTQHFDIAALGRIEPHAMSILLNDDGRGTHGFRFFADDGFVEETTIDAVRLSNLLEYARGALREVAWSSRGPFVSAQDTPYRYQRTSATQLEEDLIRLARQGYRLWSDALAELGVRGPKVRELRRRMRAPAALQIALKQSAAHVFPAALVYDHPLESTSKALTVCARFRAALAAREELTSVDCFRGSCPSYGASEIVCPSGFWGFRHELGIPLHLGKRGEVATSVLRGALTRIVAGYSTDPELKAALGHLEMLKTFAGIAVAQYDERGACLRALTAGDAHIAYFYCHGGVTAGGTPYLEIGAPRSQPIVAADLVDRVWWDRPRPLVVLNGCHTTDATPEQMFGLVEGFVVHSNAAGVIGTEITIFEPIATRFGEELLRRFVAGESVGTAVRSARLALLAEGNPLGLVYIPFALASLRLADA